MYDLRILHGAVYLDGVFENTNVYIKNGIIVAITTDEHDALETYDCNGDFVFPGIIDPHTHFELDLGNISSVDDFYTGTKAAAFGGVTTIIDFMEPVQTSRELERAFHRRQHQAKKSVIDYKLHACLRDPKDIPSITKTMNKFNLNTVKIFTTYSDSSRRTYDPEIKTLLKHTVTDNFMVTAHIENDEMIDLDPDALYNQLPDKRPTESETSEALKLAEFVRETNGYLYMVHCSSGKTIQALKKHYGDLLHTHFLVESCPHYFTFDRRVLDKEDGYLYTMAPPLRSDDEQQLLIDNINEIDTIGTDHCTFRKGHKMHDKISDMPLGVGGVEESFRILYTKFGDTIVDKMTKNVAKAHRLFPQKGILQVGSDADMFVYHKTPSIIRLGHGTCDYTIYQGMKVNGNIRSTISHGRFVVKDGVFIPKKGRSLQ